MLRIEGMAAGQAARPLEVVKLLGAEGATVTVRDGRGRVYFEAAAGGEAEAEVAFRVGGALGHHTVEVRGDGADEPQVLSFPVRAETRIDDAGGQFAELLSILYATMLGFHETGMVRWRGRVYRFFVRWLRDHVHTLKGMKYFHPELTSAIDLYRDSQRQDGMIWDNVMPRGPEPNAWDQRFAYGGFIRPFEDYTAEFKRIPVENDVEYLFVEGLYYTWKAVGDDAWMASCLDAAVRALDYSATDPYRWSDKYQLLKRGFTIDTWDFQNAQDARISAGGDPVSLAFGDPMAVRVGHTRFGVMFGDNTGYAASCGYLAAMLRHAGRDEEAERFRLRGRDIKRRLDELAWNGRHYVHHVGEDRTVRRDLGVDLDEQVSLSNAYSLNRGLTGEQCAAIIETYRRIRSELPGGSPGEWYTIYPPFEKGYDKHNAKWQYMNGGVTPIVAGELAHGAFEHGYESYGADILRRVLALGRAHGGRLHCVFTGAAPAPPERTFTPLDIAGLANTDFDGHGAPGVPGWTGEGDNDLGQMPVARQELAGIAFDVPDPVANGRRGCIGLSNRPGYAPRAELAVGAEAASVYLLHTVSQLSAGVAGAITLVYADGTRFCQDVVQGRHVSGWWMPEAPDRRTSTVAWRGRNKLCTNVGVIAWGLDNPHPDKPIARIVLDGPRGGGTWLVLALTLCDQPVCFPPSPVSYGIPENWGAAAVVYALIEGLVGVRDEAVAYERALLAPRWPAADVHAAEATVVYPASGGYLAYTYKHDPAVREIHLAVTGGGQTCSCHLLLPAGADTVQSVAIDGEPASFSLSTIEKSAYADFAVDASRPREVTVCYA